MIVTVAKYGDRVAVEMPADETAAAAKIDDLAATHGAGSVFVDGVSVALLRTPQQVPTQDESAASPDAGGQSNLQPQGDDNA